MVVGEVALNFNEDLANIFLRHFYTPQDLFPYSLGLSALNIFTLQIKNIKLHIVTDIKVTNYFMFDFRISSFGWGAWHYNILMKYLAIELHKYSSHNSLSVPRESSLLACLLALVI